VRKFAHPPTAFQYGRSGSSLLVGRRRTRRSNLTSKLPVEEQRWDNVSCPPDLVRPLLR
jgi:hypothetical protein